MKTPVFIAVAAAAALSGSAALTVDKVQQRYPWNGLVDIDYTMDAESAAALGLDDQLTVTFVDLDADATVTNRAITFQQPLPLAAGSHRITWDANADGYAFLSGRLQVMLDVTHIAEVYMIIDVTSGADSSTYPVTYMQGAPLEGFNQNAYKGDKIVLRRINPGAFIAGKTGSYKGDGSNDKPRLNILTNVFWIGIFELTQKQWFNVKGDTPASNKGDYHPLENVAYTRVRSMPSWPAEKVPNNNSLLLRLCDRCKSADASGNYTVPVKGFDLPTEAQWEFACRAGSTGAYYSATPQDDSTDEKLKAQLDKLGRYGASSHVEVGSYEPNGFGLYDMHGNVWEHCRDVYVDDPTKLPTVEPTGGATAGDYHVGRGGAYNAEAFKCTSSFRYQNGISGADVKRGYRIGRFE